MAFLGLRLRTPAWNYLFIHLERPRSPETSGVESVFHFLICAEISIGAQPSFLENVSNCFRHQTR